MFKKYVIAGFVLLFLNACGSGANPILGIGDSPDSGMAVLVGKIILVPMIDEDGEPTKSKADLLNFNAIFTKGDGSKRSQKPDKFWDEKYDTNFDDTPINKFFAVEIDPQNKVSWNGAFFHITRKSFFSDSKFFSSNLRGFMVTANDKIQAGQAYYMGTIVISLSKKGFKEIGDERYDMQELQYIVPAKLNLKNEYSLANTWFKKNYKKNLIKAKLSQRGVKTKSVYTETTMR
jgi:hypothetical protein